MFKRVINWAIGNSIWSALTSATVVTGVLTIWAWLKHAPGYIIALVAVIGFVVSPFIPKAASELRRLAASRRGRSTLPTGGKSTWKYIKVIVHIPDDRQSRTPRGRAEGLGKWEEFAVHNLWANRPETVEDFAAWRHAFHSWSNEVKQWMESAGCEYLDVKEFFVLGDVPEGRHHNDPALNHELNMLWLHRQRLLGLVRGYREQKESDSVVPPDAEKSLRAQRKQPPSLEALFHVAPRQRETTLRQLEPLRVELALVPNAPEGTPGLWMRATSQETEGIKDAVLIITDVRRFNEATRTFGTSPDVHGSETAIPEHRMNKVTLHPGITESFGLIRDEASRLEITDVKGGHIRMTLAGGRQISYYIESGDRRSVFGQVCFWWTGPNTGVQPLAWEYPSALPLSPAKQR